MNEAEDHYQALMAELHIVVTAYLAGNPDCNAGVAAQVLRNLADALTGHHSY
jgi:hypothetical protein